MTIEYFDRLKDEISDEALITLTIELEDQTFNSYEDIDKFLDYVEDEYNEVLSQQDYLYLFDLANSMFEVDEEDDEGA